MENIERFERIVVKGPRDNKQIKGISAWLENADEFCISNCYTGPAPEWGECVWGIKRGDNHMMAILRLGECAWELDIDMGVNGNKIISSDVVRMLLRLPDTDQIQIVQLTTPVCNKREYALNRVAATITSLSKLADTLNIPVETTTSVTT